MYEYKFAEAEYGIISPEMKRRYAEGVPEDQRSSQVILTDYCNQMAQEGWRLHTFFGGATDRHSYLVFEREA